jgi:hypothetical protein
MPADRDHFIAMQEKSAQVRRAASLERHIREALEKAPPLTADQRAQLAALLVAPRGGDADAA